MVEAWPGPLGLCPVQVVTKVEQDSKIWLANLGSHLVEIEENQVVATAECVTEGPGTCSDEVDGLVRREALHLNEGERQQLQAAMLACQQIFAAGKGDLGQTVEAAGPLIPGGSSRGGEEAHRGHAGNWHHPREQ